MPDGIVSHRRGHANTTMAPQSCELHIGRNGEELLFARLQQPTLMNDVETRFDSKTLVARIRMRFQRRGGRKHIVTPDGSEIIPTGNPQPDGTLVKALARAWRWQRLLGVDVYASVTETPGALAAVNRYNHLLRRRGAGGRCLGPRGNRSPALRDTAAPIAA